MVVYSEVLELNELDTHPPRYRDLVGMVITSLKDDAAYENHAQGHTWKFTYGSVQIFVHLSGEASNDVLSIWAPMLFLPVQREADLMRILLTKNWNETLEARFCIWNDQVALSHCRTLEGLSVAELSRAVTLVASLADEYDDVLQKEFSA